ncbi:hypothetical protein LUZ60_001824 [Juncus effusus]|nr:hypothetical protein LUZ60_001824 [Juncus effusus]
METHSLLLLLATFFTLFLIPIVISKLQRKSTSNLPPGPRALPFIGHLHLMDTPIHQVLHRLTLRHGPLIHIRLGQSLCIVAGSADIARELLKTNDIAFAERPSTIAARTFSYGTSGFAFAPIGAHWRYVKRLCMSELLGSRTMEQLFPIRNFELMSFLSGILARARENKAVDLSEELIKLTNNIITRMVASTTAGQEAEAAHKVFKQVAELLGSFNLEDHTSLCRGLDIQGLNKRIREVHLRFDEIVEGMIQGKEEMRKNERAENKGKKVKDLLDILLDVAGEENSEIKLSRENIKGFLLDVLTAGSDSSAVTIEWALAELLNNPTILTKLREEIDEIVGTDRLVQETDLPNLPYLQAVLKETMRLHPADPMTMRISRKETTISGYTIPANTILFVNIWSIGKDPKYWVDPLEFKPERFLEGSNVNLDVKGQNLQLIPFGSGMRTCPGIALAFTVMPVALAALIQCFDWKIGGDNVQLEMDEEKGGLVVGRAKPLVAVPVSRLVPSPLM